MPQPLHSAGFHTQLFHGLGKNLLVSFVSHVGDETALFSTQKVTGATDVQILHGDIETASEVGKLFDGLEPAAGIVGKGNQRRNNQIAESLFVRSSHAPA